MAFSYQREDLDQLSLQYDLQAAKMVYDSQVPLSVPKTY